MKILLACNAGMSTGIMENLLKNCAEKSGRIAEIKAVPLSELNTELKDTDVILLGPQVRFSLPEVKKLAGDSIIVMVISSQDFGLMRADNVWKQVMRELAKRNKI